MAKPLAQIDAAAESAGWDRWVTTVRHARVIYRRGDRRIIVGTNSEIRPTKVNFARMYRGDETIPLASRSRLEEGSSEQSVADSVIRWLTWVEPDGE